MFTQLNFLIAFSLVAGVNLIILFLTLLFRKNNTLSNKTLGVLIFIPGTTLISNAVMYAEGYYSYPFLLYLVTCVPLLFGPTLITYIHLMEGKPFQFRIKQLLHYSLIPITLAYGLYLQLQPIEVIHANYLKIVSGEDMVMNTLYLVLLLHFMVYITWGILKVKKYKVKIENFQTTYDGVNYNWLRFLVNNLLLLNIILTVIYVIQIFFFPKYAAYFELLFTSITATCFYSLVVYKSISNNLLFDKTTFDELVTRSQSLHVVTKKTKLGIEPKNLEQLQTIKKELDKQLDENKVYTNPQLSIQKLADEIGCGRTILSQTINRLYRVSFFDLINNSRVEEAKKLLLNPKYSHIKIDAIGEMAGFSSRTSFFSVFKKITGSTPSSFKEIHG